MLIFLYGQDTFRSRQQLKKMIEKFKKDRDPSGLNVVRLDAEKTEGGKILEEMLAIPFLAERRMVVIENLLVSKREDVMQEVLRRIEEKTLPESNVMVFWEAVSAPSEKKKKQQGAPSTGSGQAKTKIAKELFARLQKEKYAQSFEMLIGAKLSAWIASEVKERGGAIEKEAIQYLVQHVGSDMWRLNSLLDQLVAYSGVGADKEPLSGSPLRGGREIAAADAQLFLDEKADDNIFNLVDAIVAKQAKQAFQMIEGQYRIGEDAQFIFAMLIRQFRILLELRDLYEREDAAQSHLLAERLGLHPFVVKKSLPLMKRYSMDELKKIYEQLLDLDVKTKTGQGRPEVLLDVLVGRICAQR